MTGLPYRRYEAFEQYGRRARPFLKPAIEELRGMSTKHLRDLFERLIPIEGAAVRVETDPARLLDAGDSES